MYKATATATADSGSAAGRAAYDPRAIRKGARCDTLVASTVLLLLLAGWLVRLSDTSHFRWVGDFWSNSLSRHA